MSPIRVAYVTNVVPHYREGYFRELFKTPEIEVTVYCQSSIPGMNLTTVHDRFAGRVRLVRASSLVRERLGWQRLPWRELFRDYDVLAVQGNPRVLSNLLLASAARLTGRKLILFGQAHTAGASPMTEWLRLQWWRCFPALFVYSDREAEWLRNKGFTRQVIVGMNNGLDQRAIDAAALDWPPARLDDWQRQQGLAGHELVLSCARLEPKNRFDVWIEAMPRVLERHPGMIWGVIGAGQQLESLKARAAELGVEPAIRWLGGITDEAQLAPWFLSSQLLVHPAGIGLTLLHAFGYGLPVVTNDDPASHMPEFAALTPHHTGLLFKSGDTASLATTVCNGISDAGKRHEMACNARRVAREQFNTSIMAKRFAGLVMTLAESSGAMT